MTGNNHERRRRLSIAKQMATVAAVKGKLSPRQKDVLKALLEGRKLRAVANDLGLGVGTVDTYVRRLYRRFQVSCRSELFLAVLSLIEHGRPEAEVEEGPPNRATC